MEYNKTPERQSLRCEKRKVLIKQRRQKPKRFPTSTRNLAQIGCVDDKQNLLHRLSVIILPHYGYFTTQLTDRDAFLGLFLRWLFCFVVDCVNVCSDCVDRVGREIDAARILDAVEKHRPACFACALFASCLCFVCILPAFSRITNVTLILPGTMDR
jgi:hypothetical protein